MEFETKIKNAFHYARHSQAVWWYLGYAVAVTVLGAVLLLALLFGAGVRTISSLLSNPGQLAIAFVFVLAWLGAAVLGGNAVNGTVIRNTVDGGPMKQSWTRFRPRFWSLLGAAIAVGVVSGVISSVSSGLLEAAPGGLLQGVMLAVHIAVSLAIALSFMFYEYAIVNGEKGAFSAIGQSVDLFRQQPLKVAVTLLVVTIAVVALYLAVLVVLGALALALVWATGISVAAIPSWAVLLAAVAVPVMVLAHFFIQAFQHHLLSHAFLEISGTAHPIQKAAPSRIPSAKTARTKAGSAKKSAKKPGRSKK